MNLTAVLLIFGLVLSVVNSSESDDTVDGRKVLVFTEKANYTSMLETCRRLNMSMLFIYATQTFNETRILASKYQFDQIWGPHKTQRRSQSNSECTPWVHRYPCMKYFCSKVSMIESLETAYELSNFIDCNEKRAFICIEP